jgi:opacity protein-like surface antigen
LLSLSIANSPGQYAPYPASPPYQYGNFYLNGDVGVSFLQDLTIRNLGTKVSFHTGSRADLSLGYNIAKQLAVEFETGVIWNSLNADNSQVITPLADRINLYQVPLLANLVYKVPLAGGITPYIGAGVGGVVSTLDLETQTGPGFGHGYWRHPSDTDCAFAYQGLAGVKFPLGWNMDIGLGYKFLGTLDHSWFEGDPNLFTQTGGTYSHSVLATFTWRF